METTRSHFKSIAVVLALAVAFWSAASVAAAAAGGYGSGPVTPGGGATDGGKIYVGGRGEVEVEPDKAVIHLSATGRSESALDAQQQMQSTLARMYDALRSLGYTDEDVRSRNSSLSPRWNWEDGERVLIDYEARTSVEVTVRRLDDAAPTLQRLVESGVDQIDRIEYEATDIQDAYAKALTDAVEEAFWKAETIARASGQRISRVGQIDELGAPGPVYRAEQANSVAFAAMSRADTVELQPSTITVRAEVRVEFQTD